MAKEQISLRLEEELLVKVGDVANSEGWTRTQAIEKALRFFVETDGGKALQSGIAPPGLTPAFVSWLKALDGREGVSFLVSQGGAKPPLRYTGVMEAEDIDATLADGLLALRIRVDTIGDWVMIRLPKALIVGWTLYTSDFEVNKQVALGLEESGNARIESLFSKVNLVSEAGDRSPL